MNSKAPAPPQHLQLHPPWILREPVRLAVQGDVAVMARARAAGAVPVDQALEDAMAAFDGAKREAILQKSAQVVAEDAGIIPLFHYQNLWAAKRHLKVTPQTSDRTTAMMVSRTS